MPFQAVLLLQRAFRARRDWAAEMAKLRALLGFERASVRGQRRRSGSPTLVERREAASAIQAAVRARNARRQRQPRARPEVRDGAISLVISDLDQVLSGLDQRVRAQVDAEAEAGEDEVETSEVEATSEQTSEEAAVAEAEGDGEAAAAGMGGERGEGGSDPPPPPPHTAEAAEAVPAELAIGDGRVVERALQSPRAPAAPRRDDGAPRATGSSRTKARQLPGWMYERVGDGA